MINTLDYRNGGMANKVYGGLLNEGLFRQAKAYLFSSNLLLILPNMPHSAKSAISFNSSQY